MARARDGLGENCCKYFDGSACTLMSLKTPKGYLDDKGDPCRPGTGNVVCGRQLRGWMLHAPTCRVPEFLQREYSTEFYRMMDISQEAGQVLNQIAQVDNCPHVDPSGSVGPKCSQADGPCFHPGDHEKCKIYQLNVGDTVHGKKLRNACNRAYAEMEQAHLGLPIPEDMLREDEGGGM